MSLITQVLGISFIWMTEKLNIMDALASIQNQSYWVRFKGTIHTQNESQPVGRISYKNTCLFVQFISQCTFFYNILLILNSSHW